jgi:hypothetical protein
MNLLPFIYWHYYVISFRRNSSPTIDYLYLLSSLLLSSTPVSQVLTSLVRNSHLFTFKRKESIWIRISVMILNKKKVKTLINITNSSVITFVFHSSIIWRKLNVMMKFLFQINGSMWSGCKNPRVLNLGIRLVSSKLRPPYQGDEKLLLFPYSLTEHWFFHSAYQCTRTRPKYRAFHKVLHDSL